MAKSPTEDFLSSIRVRRERTVDVAVKLLWQGNNGPSQFALDNIVDDIRVAKEIYAQVGIHPNFSVTSHQVQTPGVDLSDGLTLDTTQNSGVLHLEGEALLNAFATPLQVDVIALYISGEILTAAAPGGIASGVAIADSAEVQQHAVSPLYWSSAVSNSFKGTFLVSTGRHGKAVFAHELGHVLTLHHTNQEQDSNNWDNGPTASRNVMTGGSTSYTGLYTHDSKRFRFFQEKRMQDSQFVDPAQE